MAKATGKPHTPTFDVEAYAAALVAAAPPMTTEQLDALGQIVRSVPAAPPPAAKPARVKRRKHRQLELPYDQVDAELSGVPVQGQASGAIKLVGHEEEDPVAVAG